MMGITPAFHNWGRWIAHCKSEVCVSAAQLVRGQESFICECRDTQICQHGSLCKHGNLIKWPDDPAAIEATLAPRPLANRHWYPHETVKDLEVENMVHGI